MQKGNNFLTNGKKRKKDKKYKKDKNVFYFYIIFNNIYFCYLYYS